MRNTLIFENISVDTRCPNSKFALDIYGKVKQVYCLIE